MDRIYSNEHCDGCAEAPGAEVLKEAQDHFKEDYQLAESETESVRLVVCTYVSFDHREKLSFNFRSNGET